MFFRCFLCFSRVFFSSEASDEQFDGAAAGSEWCALARGARERATVARQDMLEARCDGGS